MNRRTLLAFLASLFAPPVFAQKTVNEAGTVDLVEGAVTVQRADKSRYTPKVGDTLNEGDGITTGKDSEIHLKMVDGGLVAVRPDTKMRIAQYQATGEATDRSTLGLLEGGMRVVSGWIASVNPKGYQIRTSIATIGIRGTDHETQVRLKDDGEDGAGIYDRVFAGGTFIKSKDGRVDVTPNRVGFFGSKKGAKPMLIDRVPRFYRGTRNENRIEGLHGRLQGQLPKLREERRARLKEAAEKKGKRHPKRD
ncbi:hypothetical protein BWI17_02060 [Betaproteobacteria bacterium GR16-43]|nr:hypothetical protein BWI17_02060 [Betaproteobacteria bacterium GR16-43]